MTNPPVRKWYKSSRSETSNQCVEVYQDNDRVGVRDSKNPDGPELFFAAGEWDSFLAGRLWER
ncbi:DUF397 domain-containing protein [Nocardia sp. NPDC088792]|uniref:DUF397 domain-containing protein n=1 Tax=Nocardia sp. NPDC088792 TaxID=3364332 RepID=UPI00382BF1DE